MKDYAIKHGYRSGLEKLIGKQLAKAKKEFQYEAIKYQYLKPQVRPAVIIDKHGKEKIGTVSFNPVGKVSLILSYTPDFFLTKKDGSLMVVETKGRFVAKDRDKIRRFKKTYPEIDFRMVFSNPDQWLSKKGLLKTYGDFCDELDIPWSKKIIPKEWLKEVKDV